CWDNEPDNRPDMSQVVDRLNSIITKLTMKENKKMNIDDEASLYSSSVIASSNINNSLHGDVSRLIENYDQMK
ncbi:17690_t:CDS:1, partial [Funneliformis geosporum]